MARSRDSRRLRLLVAAPVLVLSLGGEPGDELLLRQCEPADDLRLAEEQVERVRLGGLPIGTPSYVLWFAHAPPSGVVGLGARFPHLGGCNAVAPRDAGDAECEGERGPRF